uniref:[Pyruvate dehydrogenase [acetyl-transferring]]-phosphatase 1, mitochondrial n=1 Tax=Aceria tosichella TaxID=561515 RepID=A0A6G1S5M3_9ACAR
MWIFHASRRFATTLTPRKINELLSANEVFLGAQDALPTFVKSIECNQLASNSPIEDRIRVSSVQLPHSKEPTLILGVFDGHGGGTTADLISRRLFNYIALSLHPTPGNLKISKHGRVDDIIVDLHNSPQPTESSRLQAVELSLLDVYRNELSKTQSKNLASTDNEPDHQSDVVAHLKSSFQRCDDDLSQEIQQNLLKPTSLDQQSLRHYLSATVSGCCALVMVIHQGSVYLASSGDCRAVLGLFDGQRSSPTPDSTKDSTGPHIEHPKTNSYKALELNDEHNCDNINEIRRLTASHPRSEQNTMIRHNRLLGHLMPFRAFGDFNYKWPAETIRACGITRAFGPGVIPSSYETPPYLIVEPDVNVVRVDALEDTSMKSERQVSHITTLNELHHGGNGAGKYLVMASDGLWEQFESSRDVVEAIVDHSLNAHVEGNEEDYDPNCATYILRSALRFGPHQDIGMDVEKMRRIHHIRLESTLTLPKSVVRNFRDDISIIVLKLD